MKMAIANCSGYFLCLNKQKSREFAGLPGAIRDISVLE